MGMFMPSYEDVFKQEKEEENKRKSMRRKALNEIADYYISLNKDEKEGLIKIIKDKGKEIRKEKLIDKRNKINKELGIQDTSPSLEEFIESEKDYELLEKLHNHTCKEFQRVVDELLGKDYYNMGMDQYACTTIMADDIIRKYGKKRKRGRK